MPNGVVKWTDPRKGFGFINSESNETIFVHFSEVGGDGFRFLKPGDKVSYDIGRDERGVHAKNVVVLTEADNSRQGNKMEKRDGKL